MRKFSGNTHCGSNPTGGPGGPGGCEYCGFAGAPCEVK